MRKVVLAFVLASIVTQGTAADRTAQVLRWTFCDKRQVPPAEFDYEPNVPYQVAPLPPDIVRAICNATAAPAAWHGGCAFYGDDDASIVIRNDLTPGERACLMRHERAHINGWVHPEGVFSTQPRGPLRKRPIYTPVE